jgi:hypothetical protein
MSTIIEAGFLAQKLTAWMASKGLVLEVTLLTTVLMLAQVQWIKDVSSNRHIHEQYYPLIQLK